VPPRPIERNRGRAVKWLFRRVTGGLAPNTRKPSGLGPPTLHFRSAEEGHRQPFAFFRFHFQTRPLFPCVSEQPE
jgi:hypothetical protein